MGLRERKKAETRARILSECAALFREHGFDATAIDDIVSAAGISRQTFFNYFSGKDAALAELGLAWLRDQARPPEAGARKAGQGPVLARMRAAIAAQARAIEADRDFVALVVTRSNLFAGPVSARRAHVRAIYDAVAAVLRAGQASGEIDPGVRAEAAAELLVSALFMTVRHWAGGYWPDDTSLEGRMMEALDLLENGLRGTGSGKPA